MVTLLERGEMLKAGCATLSRYGLSWEGNFARVFTAHCSLLTAHCLRLTDP